MSNSKESTLKTQLSLSIDSEIFEDSALLSGFDMDLLNSPQKFPTSKQIQDLLSEIELINEDRLRLRRENEKLKSQLSSLPLKNVQIELLTKVATKALSENCKLKEKLTEKSPPKQSPKKIKLRSPSESIPLSVLPLKECNFIKQVQGSDTPRSNSSPLKSNRNTSARIRVARNYLKYPRPVNLKNTSGDVKVKNIL